MSQTNLIDQQGFEVNAQLYTKVEKKRLRNLHSIT